MSANIFRQKSADGLDSQVTKSRVKRPQYLFGVSVLTGLMVFFLGEKSPTAYASELTNAAPKTQGRSLEQESSSFSLSQIEYPSHKQRFLGEEKQHQQASAATIDDSLTFAESIYLEQNFLAEHKQRPSQAGPMLSEEAIKLVQEPQEENAPEPTAKEEEAESLPMFGDQGSNRWYVQVGAATDIENGNDGDFGLVGAGLTHFFLNGHSVNLELNGLGFLQDDDDAVGVNLALIMRWHVLRRPNWSLYVDGGAGLIGTTNNVPSSGSQFNFTPQVGAGTTIRVSEQKHLMLGLRWHHISNADLYEGNPGLDTLMGYVGLNFPF